MSLLGERRELLGTGGVQTQRLGLIPPYNLLKAPKAFFPAKEQQEETVVW